MTYFTKERFKKLAGILKEGKNVGDLALRWMERLGYSGEVDQEGNPTLTFDIRSFLRVFNIEETGVDNGYFYITFKKKSKES